MVANTTLNVSMIAKEALMLLDNNLVMAKLVHRTYEDEWDRQYNGYKIGDTLSIRRPALYTVRDGATASVQDSIEGTTSITIDKQKGVDLSFSSKDMTLQISEFAERFLKAPMISLANQVDLDLMGLYNAVPSWVGTPGQTINSWADFALAPQRLMQQAVPMDGEVSAVLSPGDGFALAGSFISNQWTGNIPREAIEKAKIPTMAMVTPYVTQNVRNLTVGTRVAADGNVAGANQNVTYSSVRTTYTQTFLIDGLAGAATIAAGEVFTIADVYAVNPVTKETQSYLQQFVVTTAATCDGGGAATLTISPPIITSGAYQTVDSVPANAAVVTFLGTASTGYLQNMAFHKNAFALCMVPMELPAAAVVKSRQSYKGLSVRLISTYDGTNDLNFWRLDILYGVKCIDNRLATRISGTA